MKLKSMLFIIVFLSGMAHGVAQQKFEREYRLDAAEVPQKAKEFIKNCDFKKRIKWYAEESQDGKTYEAKTIKNNHKLSIEFDLNGTVLDVEKTVVLDEIVLETRNQIKAVLTERFGKYKLKKIQVQYTGEASELINYIKNKKTTFKANLFEIVLKSKTERAFYEVLVNRQGKILKELSFAPRNFDNLEH